MSALGSLSVPFHKLFQFFCTIKTAKNLISSFNRNIFVLHFLSMNRVQMEL